MPPRTRRRLAGLALAALGIALGVLLLLRPPADSTIPALPNPNAYDTFVQLGALVSFPDYRRDREPSDAEVDSYVVSNRVALTQAVAALGLASRVPVPRNPDLWAPHGEALVRVNALGRAFAQEAGAALRRKDWDAGVASTTNGLRLVHLASHGGLLIHDMVAVAGIRVHLKPLGTALPSLPAPAARAAGQALLAIDATRDPYADVRANELAYGRRVPGFAARCRWWILGRRECEKMLAGHESRRDGAILELRTLALRLAARAYELDHGRRPDAAAALVPDYLPELPVDPISSKPLDLPVGTAGPP